MNLKCLLIIVGLTLSTAPSLAQTNADQTTSQKKKAVRIQFDGRPSSRRLSQVELIEKDAYIRHMKRMKADYNQEILEIR